MRLLTSIAGLLCLIPLASGQSIFGGNILVNAGAESGAGGSGQSPVTSVPGWSKTGGCDVYAYATAYLTVNALGPQDIEPAGQGNNYFAGGTNAASCTFTQSIDISSGATAIDAGTATFSLAGYFGAYSTVSDNATLTVAFQGASGNQLSTVTTGGVGANDRPQDSGLYFRRQIGQIPAGARKAAVTLNMNWVDGSDNEAFADNLAFILNASVAPQSLVGVNLLVNPGADASPGITQNSPGYVSNDLPGWVRSAYVTADSYQDVGGDLYQAAGLPVNAGASYFYGGATVIDSNNPIGTAYQDIDVSSAASLIDGGTLPYTLSGWLGGYDGQDDNIVLTIQFENWSGTVLGTGTIGPVLSADRQGTSSILLRSTNGSVPKGTRMIHVLMTITRTDGENNDGLADSLSLVLGASAAQGPSISQTIITAGAYGAFDSVTPGTWMEIYGANLAPDARIWGGGDFVGGINAPTSLDGTSVTIGGQSAFVYYISPGQVDAQVPSNIGTGPQPVLVTTTQGTSVPFLISVNSLEPGFLAPSSFVVNGNQYVAALFPDGVTFVLPPGAIAGVASRQAKPGDTIVLYGVGFGPVTPSISAGQTVQGSNSLASTFQLMFGSTPAASIPYFGLAPGYIGLYQFDVVVPNVSNSDLVPLTFTLGGVMGTQTLFTAVHN